MNISNFEFRISNVGARRTGPVAKQVRGAFTLIELLVVVAIIAVLVAMLLPGLAAARESATSLRCMNQVWRVGQAFVAYGNDYHGRTMPWVQGPPMTGDPRPDRNFTVWSAVLAGMNGGANYLGMNPYRVRENLYVCPKDNPIMVSDGNSLGCSLTLNPYAEHRETTRFTRASQFVVLCEWWSIDWANHGQWASHYWDGQGWAIYGGKYLYDHHAGRGCGILFGDFHVAMAPQSASWDDSRVWWGW